MAQDSLTDKLAVILHADVAGSTQMVQQNEHLAHERIQQTFQIFSTTIEKCSGKVLELRGDALVAEFERPSNAVTAAFLFQADHSDYLASIDDEMRPEVRVGIAMGEVVIADNTVTGAGVVLAQRVEQLAEVGGLCITAAVHESLSRRLPVEFENLGQQVIKGFGETIGVYKVTASADFDIPLPETKPATARSSAQWRLIGSVSLVALIVAGVFYWVYLGRLSEYTPFSDSLQDKPTIAVLPFANMSDDPEQEYFADGITDDLITDLTRFDGIRVLAGTTTFKLRGQKIDYRQLVDDLKISHVLEGSVRRSGDKMRISARLISARDGESLWAERYDKPLNDIFDVQDDVSSNIADALSVQLTEQDKLAFERPTTSSFEAYDLYLQGRRLLDQRTRETNQMALELYQGAIELDPNFARAYGAIAVALIRSVTGTYKDNPEQAKEKALFYARKAVELGKRSQNTYWALGFTHLFRGEFEAAETAVAESLRIAPNYADGMALMALLKNYLEQPREAIDLIEKAMLLNPGYSWDYPYNLGYAYYLLEDYPRAIEYLTSALERNLNARPPRLQLIACYMEIGAIDDAEWEMEQMLTQYPDYTVGYMLKGLPMLDTPRTNRFIDLLRQAGLPD
ncbi:MAG: adenylate/guanylate cyclase domain-containing protein [Gammaproteobacteria bacterium]|nr:MAG: adenylate/guanylate cyclase domain-containing protein [Gammaproteobacteria bacterium]